MSRDVEMVHHWFERHGPPTGERLPPERALAETLGVSRAALRKGLAALEAQGLLSRHVGRGTFVLGEAASSAAGDRRDDVPTAAAAPRQVLVARLALEPTLARMAAREGHRLPFRAIEAAEAACSAAVDWVAYDAADEAFHRSIADASGNPVLVRLFETISAEARGVDWGGLRRRDGTGPGEDDPALRDHATIRAAVLARDVPGAGDAMTRHILAEMASLVDQLV